MELTQGVRSLTTTALSAGTTLRLAGAVRSPEHSRNPCQLSGGEDQGVVESGSVPGWQYVHVCVDDVTRLAYVEVLAGEKALTAIGFLKRTIDHYASYGIKVERVMTDNGSAYVSFAHTAACRALGIKHIRTRPYRPRTNGKAGRFIRTMLGGWADGSIYGSSPERTRALSGWLDFYFWKRPPWLSGKTATHNSTSRSQQEQRAWSLHLAPAAGRPVDGASPTC